MARKKTSAVDNATGPSMLQRFEGASGRRRLLDLLSGTFLLHGITTLEELISKSRLSEIKAGEPLMKQGDTDDSIHLILSGSLEVEVNGRYWTTRYAGNHVGEGSMVDPTAKRNATVKAAEHSIVLSCNEDAFSEFANHNPDIWRRIAVELSRRLTERTKLTPIPRSEPVMFLGCSTEALTVAQEIQASLRHDALVKIWTDGVFNPSKNTMEDLCELSKNVDFAAVLLTPDDKTVSRHRQKVSPRDNVLLELGLMMGAVGRERTFFIFESGSRLKLPSDLLGLTPINYEPIGTRDEIQARLGPTCTELRRLINRHGPL